MMIRYGFVKLLRFFVKWFAPIFHLAENLDPAQALVRGLEALLIRRVREDDVLSEA